jgi:hypothetical protein
MEMTKGKERHMFTSGTPNVYRGFSVVIAASIVALSGLALDRGHIAAAPDGTVEVGQLMPADALPGVAALAEVVVTAPRYAMIARQSGA